MRLDRDRCLPAHGARGGVERDDGVRLAARRRRRVIDHVAVDAERFDARRRCVRRHVLPQRSPVAAFSATTRLPPSRLPGVVRYMTPRCTSGMISSWPAGSGFDQALQRADVGAIDLVEGAVAMGVVGPAVHQPVGGIGIAQHGIGDRRRCDTAQQLGAINTGLSKRGVRERCATQRNECNRLARHGRSPEVQTRSSDGIGFATPRPIGPRAAPSALRRHARRRLPNMTPSGLCSMSAPQLVARRHPSGIHRPGAARPRRREWAMMRIASFKPRCCAAELENASSSAASAPGVPAVAPRICTSAASRAASLGSRIAQLRAAAASRSDPLARDGTHGAQSRLAIWSGGCVPPASGSECIPPCPSGRGTCWGVCGCVGEGRGLSTTPEQPRRGHRIVVGRAGCDGRKCSVE